MDNALRELKYAIRTLTRTPIIATVVVLSLGIGVGVNTVIFSWIQALMFRPLPGVADASAFHVVEPRGESGGRPGTSWLEYRDFQERLQTMPNLIAFRMVPFSLGEASQTERVYGLMVSGNYFSGLGLQPVLGRFFRSDEAVRAGTEPVVVISHEQWQSRFGGSPGAIGQTMRLNNRDLTVIGVTPDGFQGTILGLQFDLWVPATMAPALLAGSRELDDRNLRGYFAMSRLAPGRSIEQAQSEVAGVMADLARDYPDSTKGMTGEVLPFWRASRGPQGLMLQGLAILQGIMLLLLLAVCGNTANLVLARASVRQREVGVRLAMGAGWWRIARLLLVENLVLGISASALGVLIAIWGTNALRAFPLTMAFPVKFQTSVNEGGLLFAIGLGVVCALGFGAAPALHLAKVDPQNVLRSASTGLASAGLRRVVMALQVAMALAVLISAGLFLRGMQETHEDPGFQREGLMLAGYDLTGRQVSPEISRDFARRLLDRLREIPDIETAAIAISVPLDIHGLPVRGFTLEGRARTDGTPDRALSNIVTPGYFQAMRIDILQGQDFAELADTTLPMQVIVNQEFVRRYIGDGEVINRRLENNGRPYVIAGVVRNSLYESYSEPPTPIVYYSFRDRPASAGDIHVRARTGDESQLASVIARAVRDVDQSLPVYNVRSMTAHVETNLTLRRIPARMFVVLGPLLLLLAAVGIYAVVAYTVSQRTVEIGVRIALGATANGVVKQIVLDAMRVVAAGALFGWLIVYGVYIHLVRGPIDPAAFGGVPLLLLAVSAFAAWLPARRATNVDPMVALRHE